MPEMFATMLSTALSELICYPAETVIHRLYIQATRTLFDNLDTGTSAISITAKYTGFFDCFKNIVNREGVSALYSVSYSNGP
jgi:solute carrier family 25 protein 46